MSDIGEELNIDVVLTSTWDGGGVEEANESIQTVGETTKVTTRELNTLSDSLNTTSDSSTHLLGEARSVSWDMMLLGRSMNIVNNTLLGHNAAVKEAVGVLYVFAAASRIALVTADMFRLVTDFLSSGELKRVAAINAEAVAQAENNAMQNQANIIATSTLGLSAEQIASLLTESGAVETYTAALEMATAAKLAFNAAQSAGVGLGAASAITTIEEALPAVMTASAVLGFQHGGVVPYTGLHLVHQGETVIPKGVGMTNININMQTGGISSAVDVSNMLDEMAARMVVESRRRTGV